MDAEERVSLERRMSAIESTLSAQDALLDRNTQILDEIRQYINKPKPWADMVSASAVILAAAGMLLYLAYIAPLEEKVGELRVLAAEVRGKFDMMDAYSQETRRLIDAHYNSSAHDGSTDPQ